MRIAWAWVLLGAALGCSSPPTYSGDAGPGDVGSADGAGDVLTDDRALTDVPPADVGPPPPTAFTCQPCARDEQCGAGGHCVEVDRMRAPGFRECRLECAVAGEACTAPVPSTCGDGPLGALVCVPNTAFSCIVMGSRRGDRCPDAGCTGRYSVCADLRDPSVSVGRAGYLCTAECATDEDCEDGARRCRPVSVRNGRATRVCVPDDRIGPEVCGAAPVNARGVGAPCDAMTACATGLQCLEGVDPAVRGFCSAACATASDCGGGPVTCAQVGTMGMRCVPTDCACMTGARDAALDQALSADPASRWTRCNLFFSSATLDVFGANVARDRYRLPLFDRIHRDWLAGTTFARTVGDALDTNLTSLSTALARTASLRQTGNPTGIEIPAPSTTSGGRASLVMALARWISYGNDQPDTAALTMSVSTLPEGLAGAMAGILDASLLAARQRDMGLLRALDEGARERLFRLAPFAFLPTNRINERADLTTSTDLAMFRDTIQLPVEGALRLAATIESAPWSTWRGMTGVEFAVDTPSGSVVVRGGGNDRYDRVMFGRTLLVIDLGGDDIYEAPIAANQDHRNPVSLLIDLGGNDRYEYPISSSPLDRSDLLGSDEDGRVTSGMSVPSMSRVGRQGAGRLGIALHYDLGGGRDRYKSLRMSQGFGAFGIGGLFDDGGEDEYTLEAGGQGSSVGGIGVLVDLGTARDRYTSWAYAQGFGYVQGAGLLYDRGGDDVYDAKVAPVLYPSAQSPTANASFSQGAGFGRRGDAFPDHINMSGGLGILRDYDGADQYTAGVFAQGTGYWGGMGLLLDRAGNDAYDARWYVQGAAAHFAYGALVDGGGRDTHNATAMRQNMTAGAGHDFSLGILLALGDEADTYGVPNLALGAGNANGAGIFYDQGGDDTYEAASALSLGNAALETLTDPGRLERPTVGLFLDTGGTDRYVRMPAGPVTNGAVWTQRIHPEAMSERGFGSDGTGRASGL